MDFRLTPLPYAEDALQPYLSTETLRLHHGEHHAAYLKKLEELIGETPEGQKPLEEIVRSSKGPVFDNAAQSWNHDFLWNSMCPDGGGAPTGVLADALRRDFGSLDAFRKTFLDLGTKHFGSGWVWLVADDSGVLSVETTRDADLPIRHGQTPLLTADLWEHAYYVDYRNERHAYLEAFLDHLLHWDFAAQNWTAATRARDL